MNQIFVNSQAELDNIPLDYNGRVLIKFKNAVVSKKYRYEVIATKDSSVEIQGAGSVIALQNSFVLALGQSFVVAKDRSFVQAAGWSSVVAEDESFVISRSKGTIIARDRSTIIARTCSSVESYDNSSVVAWDESTISAFDHSQVLALGDTRVRTFGQSSTVAEERCSITAFDESYVIAKGYSNFSTHDNSQVTDNTIENAHKSLKPSTVAEYIKYYDLETVGDKVKLYKVAHKRRDRYFSDHDDSYEYIVGAEAVSEYLETDPSNPHAPGMHMAHLNWSLAYGERWRDIAILEVEADISSIIVLEVGGKVRARKCKILREIPLEDCGIYGNILAKQLRMDNTLII